MLLFWGLHQLMPLLCLYLPVEAFLNVMHVRDQNSRNEILQFRFEQLFIIQKLLYTVNRNFFPSKQPQLRIGLEMVID